MSNQDIVKLVKAAGESAKIIQQKADATYHAAVEAKDRSAIKAAIRTQDRVTRWATATALMVKDFEVLTA